MIFITILTNNPAIINTVLIMIVILDGIIRIKANPRKRLPNIMPAHISALMSAVYFS